MPPTNDPPSAEALQWAMDAAASAAPAPCRRIAYHGTTRRRWAQRLPSPSTLYFATTITEAARYAYEGAAAEEADGHPPRPMVYEVTICDLAGMELGPDWGWSEATETTPWWESANEACGFTARGDVEALKARMRQSLDWRRLARVHEIIIARLAKPGSGSGRSEAEVRLSLRPKFGPADTPR
jgi:hypothetical protein